MTENPIIYADDRIPDLIGIAGKAWKQDLEGYRKLHPEEADGALCGWIVFDPCAHPLWHYYLVCCVFLRAVPGVPPAKINLAGATHEIFVIAFDPDQKRIPLNDPPRMLTPINFAGQWISESDEQAIAKVEGAVMEIVRGTLSPDTDFIQQWVQRFSGSNLKGGVL